MSTESRIQTDRATSADVSERGAESLVNEGAVEALPGHRRTSALAGGILLVIGVALAAANMRPPVTSLAAVLGETQHALGASATWASLLTTVPTLCFGLAGLAAPWLSKRWGMHRVVSVSLGLLTVALVLRVVGGAGVLLAGTFVVAAAIAMCNVLIPVVVKEAFPGRVGTVTGVYSGTMAAGGAVGSALTPSLKSALGGWQLALAVWAVLALAAFCSWLASGRQFARAQQGAQAGAGDQPTAEEPAAQRSSMLRRPLAWAVTGYFGMQSLIAYVVMGWLPEVFKGAGTDAGTAGVLLGVVLVLGVPMSLALPPLAVRARNQSWWALGLASAGFVGFLGLMIAPVTLALLWAVLIAVGMSAFPLALTLISLRSADGVDAGRLSAMAQSAGYLIASVGPFLFGVLHQATGGWQASLIMALVVLVVQGIVGVLAGRARAV